jgi:hypothetical protein
MVTNSSANAGVAGMMHRNVRRGRARTVGRSIAITAAPLIVCRRLAAAVGRDRLLSCIAWNFVSVLVRAAAGIDHDRSVGPDATRVELDSAYHVAVTVSGAEGQTPYRNELPVGHCSKDRDRMVFRFGWINIGCQRPVKLFGGTHGLATGDKTGDEQEREDSRCVH